MTREESAILDLLRGAGLQWSGTSLGLYPTITAETARSLEALGSPAIPALIDALNGESTFAGAHVLLTRLTGVEYHAKPTWNGLAVDIDSAGIVTIDPSQRFSLAQRWRLWFATDPHPARLPEAPSVPEGNGGTV